MGLSLKDLRNLLEKDLQWECDASGKHIRYRFIVNGRIVAATHYSHSWRGNDQVNDLMLSRIANQMHCSLKTLKSLLQDKRPRIHNYFEELLQGNHISKEEYDELCKKV